MPDDDLHRPRYTADPLAIALNGGGCAALLHIQGTPMVLKPEPCVEADELAAPVAGGKGSLQAPKTVDFVDSIPQTPIGKLDKKALLMHYSQEVAA